MNPLFVLLTSLAAVGALHAGVNEPLVFRGMCDASGAVALDGDSFAVASDEDNLLRFYRLSQPGKPVWTYNLNPFLIGKKKSPEADIEGAARLGHRVFWITSHERNAEGEPAPNRHRIFVLELRQRGSDFDFHPVGGPYTNLLADLERDPRLKAFRLGEAAKLTPKARGGLNIEALTDTPEGTLLIGFRNPVPEGRALVVPLLNPAELPEGRPARLGEPLLLDLGGLGLRGMRSTGTGYYLMAGPAGSGPAASSRRRPKA
jgi:hypothetical protein